MSFHEPVNSDGLRRLPRSVGRGVLNDWFCFVCPCHWVCVCVDIQVTVPWTYEEEIKLDLSESIHFDDIENPLALSTICAFPSSKNCEVSHAGPCQAARVTRVLTIPLTCLVFSCSRCRHMPWYRGRQRRAHVNRLHV